MANPETVALLLRSVSDWNVWRRNNVRVRPDLSGANLFGAELPEVDLSGADLSGVELSRANLSSANLSNANLINASLFVADLSDADLGDADLSNADLVLANLSGSYLNRANFSRTMLGRTIFGVTSLAGVKGLDSCTYIEECVIDFATLSRSGELPLAFLRGVGLRDDFIELLPSLTGGAIEFYSCFISYSHADKSFAHRLHDALQARGIRCWLDEHQVLPGDDLHDEVDRGIRLWDKVLLCCSDSSLKSWWVDRELGAAFAKEERLMKVRGRKVLVLIPLNLDGYLLGGSWESGKATEVKTRLAADFTGWSTDEAKFEAQFEKLVMALCAGEGARTKPPPSKL